MMSRIAPFPASPPPPAAVSRILSRFGRDEIEAFIAVAIDLLDTLDGDTDLESPGAEDDFEVPASQMIYADRGPGCTVCDPGGGNVDDGSEDDDEREPDYRDRPPA